MYQFIVSKISANKILINSFNAWGSQFQSSNINPSRLDPGRRKKINLNFYFHTSLWCLKRFYEGLKGLHVEKNCSITCLLISVYVISSLSYSKIPQFFIKAKMTDYKGTYGEKNYMSQVSAVKSSYKKMFRNIIFLQCFGKVILQRSALIFD